MHHLCFTDKRTFRVLTCAARVLPKPVLVLSVRAEGCCNACLPLDDVIELTFLPTLVLLPLLCSGCVWNVKKIFQDILDRSL